MKTVVMYIGDWKTDEVQKRFDQLINILGNEGVDVLENTSESLMVIQTPKVYISFVDDLRKLEGRLFDQIFGEISERFVAGHLKNSTVGRFDGTLVDYILLQEFGDGNRDND